MVSGQWNEVILDLTKASSPITQAQGVTVNTNENSTWSYDDIQTIYSPAVAVDVPKLVNSQTQMTNGGLQFKSNGSGGYNVSPTTLISSGSAQATFSRASEAYTDNGIIVATNIPRYTAAKFGNGVRIEEGTNNLINNNSFETDTANWTLGLNAQRTSAKAFNGNYSLAYINPSVAQDSTYDVAVSPNTTYTLSVMAKNETSSSARIDLAQLNGSTVLVIDTNNVSCLANSDWTQKTVTITTRSDCNKLRIRLIVDSPRTGNCYFDAIQLEQKPYATMWTTGARSAETLSYTLKKPLPEEFFASGWITPDWASTISSSNVLRPLHIGETTSNRYVVQFDPGTDSFQFHRIKNGVNNNVGSGTLSFSSKSPIFIAVANLTKSHGDLPPGLYMWYGINGGTLTKLYNSTVDSIQNLSKFYIGTDYASLSQINGSMDTLQVIDINSLENSGSSLTSTFINSQYTATTHPSITPGHLLLCNYENSVDSTYNSLDDTVTLPIGKISKISIDSTYATSSGPLTNLQAQRLYLSGVQPTKLAISGDGNKVYYGNPSDGNKLYLLDLLTGEKRKVTDYVPSGIRVNFDGTKVAFNTTTGLTTDLFLYNDVTRAVITILTSGAAFFGIKDDGSVYYYSDSSDTIYRYTSSGVTEQLYQYNASSLSGQLFVPRQGDQILWSKKNTDTNMYELLSLQLTPLGWKLVTLYSTGNIISVVNSNKDASLIFISDSSGKIYNYQVSSKALRLLDVSNIVKVTDDNKIVSSGSNGQWVVYDIDNDTSKNIRPSDASTTNNYFDVDYSGNKMVYDASGGLSTYYLNGVTHPERYLLSFDGKNSWQSYKEGSWTTVRTGSTPTIEDLTQYGMTIDEVNSLTESDFASLYENGRQVIHFDVAVYFSSVDAFTTPSLNGIKVYFNTGESQNGEEPVEKSLYTTKQQDFTATNWRKIKKVYPVEIFPKEAEAYYFILKDGVYKTYKNNQWSDVSSTVFSNVENNWIDSTNGQGITQLGMTAEELRTIPETALQSILPSTNLSVVYAMKVEDTSTERYSSLITIDYVDNLFKASTLTLKIKFIDGTIQEYTNIDKAKAEDFMEWLKERQFNRGPIFYDKFYTISNGVKIIDFINYYTIKSVSVDDTP